jgi:hypothetical protein
MSKNVLETASKFETSQVYNEMKDVITHVLERRA